MRAALSEALRGVGHTSPNPAVGALIARDGQILARGYHHFAGGPHAEIEAIAALPAGISAEGATIYVTLEPCSTHGRTAPCVEAILARKFARVVVGTLDPNPAHAGRGIELLRAAGIEVSVGVLEPECRALNLAFNRWIVTGRPWVIAKAGMSLDGRLSRPPGEGQWLTSEASRADAMTLRARVDAILIGANTLRVDNPRLSVRGVPGARQPWRVVLAGKQPLPENAHLFNDEHRERTLIYRGKSLRSVLRDLGRRQITSVLVEGGMRVLSEVFDQRLADEVQFYVAPRLCGGPVLAVGGSGVGASAQAVRMKEVAYRQIGDDVCLSGLAEYPEAGL